MNESTNFKVVSDTYSKSNSKRTNTLTTLILSPFKKKCSYGLKKEIDYIYIGAVLSVVVLITGIFSFLQVSSNFQTFKCQGSHFQIFNCLNVQLSSFKWSNFSQVFSWVALQKIYGVFFFFSLGARFRFFIFFFQSVPLWG